ncbi:MAG: SagB/ThcOx family dehydrogenase, partial [Deltaproteobacteria bacterium]|nr:SagB/ThcOx family dehydrogenase [Deltaproteobacteria bacterium]
MYWLPRRVFLKLVLLLGTFGVQWLNPFKALSAPFRRKEESMILPKPDHEGKEESMILPKPDHEGSLSVEEAIKHRRTVRSFSSKPIRKEDLSQLLYAAQGITEDRGFKRAAPSGGALYPLDVYTVAGEKGVEGLDAGIYHYIPLGHRIEHVITGDRNDQLARASLQQMWMAGAPVNFVITAEYSRIRSKYGERGIR